MRGSSLAEHSGITGGFGSERLALLVWITQASTASGSSTCSPAPRRWRHSKRRAKPSSQVLVASRSTAHGKRLHASSSTTWAAIDALRPAGAVYAETAPGDPKIRESGNPAFMRVCAFRPLGTRVNAGGQNRCRTHGKQRDPKELAHPCCRGPTSCAAISDPLMPGWCERW